MSSDGTGTTTAELVERLRDVFDRHPVSFAMVFGSAARKRPADRDDVDVAVEFEDLRPDDDGYSEAYLALYTDLDRRLSGPVDLVDVHTMSPQFARVAFDDGVIVVGPDARHTELEQELAGDPPTVEEARTRVAAAVERLRDDR